MFCTSCGCNIDENTQYCPECGKKQFDLPTDEKPYEHGRAVLIISAAIACAIIFALNYFGQGFLAFLFIPFIYFGNGKKNWLHYASYGACIGFIVGVVLSMILLPNFFKM